MLARPICLRLFRHFMATARCLALARPGNNSAARIAMMAITTSNSIKVKPRFTNPIRAGRGLAPDRGELQEFTTAHAVTNGHPPENGGSLQGWTRLREEAAGAVRDLGWGRTPIR